MSVREAGAVGQSPACVLLIGTRPRRGSHRSGPTAVAHLARRQRSVPGEEGVRSISRAAGRLEPSGGRRGADVRKGASSGRGGM